MRRTRLPQSLSTASCGTSASETLSRAMRTISLRKLRMMKMRTRVKRTTQAEATIAARAMAARVGARRAKTVARAKAAGAGRLRLPLAPCRGPTQSATLRSRLACRIILLLNIHLTWRLLCDRGPQGRRCATRDRWSGLGHQWTRRFLCCLVRATCTKAPDPRKRRRRPALRRRRRKPRVLSLQSCITFRSYFRSSWKWYVSSFVLRRRLDCQPADTTLGLMTDAASSATTEISFREVLGREPTPESSWMTTVLDGSWFPYPHAVSISLTVSSVH